MNGIIIIDKPKDFTSFDVIAKMRGILKERRLGHGGTLDPMATGVLPVFIGGATKAVDILPNERKRYTATVRFGIKTDTGDITGNVTEVSDKMPTLEQIEEAAQGFVGKIEQIPPMYSAIKIDGKKLCDLARSGKTVERKPRSIEIFSIQVLSFDANAKETVLDVECSKGTYIRTLCEDIAQKLGCIAALSDLRRTMSAGFTDSQAITLEKLIALRDENRITSVLLSVENAFSNLKKIELDDNLARLFLNGFVFESSRIDTTIPENVTLRAYHNNVFLATAVSVDGKFKKLKQFYFNNDNKAER